VKAYYSAHHHPQLAGWVRLGTTLVARSAFTMDEGPRAAVLDSVRRLYKGRPRSTRTTPHGFNGTPRLAEASSTIAVGWEFARGKGNL